MVRHCDFAPTITCDAVKDNKKGEKTPAGVTNPRLVFGGCPPTGGAGGTPAEMEEVKTFLFAAKMAAIPVRAARFPKASHGETRGQALVD